MTGWPVIEKFPTPTILPLGDSALLVRFGTVLTDAANRAAIVLAKRLEQMPLSGVVEIAPNLVSVLLRYDPRGTHASEMVGELRLRLSALEINSTIAGRDWTIAVHFDGPDLDSVAAALKLTPDAFIAAHNAQELRVLATGFAPGFVYCGLHPQALTLPRRSEVRPMVPPGTILFAAGQTAITATELPTGWHIIGHTDFNNFDPGVSPPTRLAPGDHLSFAVAS